MRSVTVALLLLVGCGSSMTPPSTAPDMSMPSGCPAWSAPPGTAGSCDLVAYQCYQHGSCKADGDCASGHCWTGVCGGCNNDCDCKGDSNQSAMCNKTTHRCAPLMTEGCQAGMGADACFMACDAVAKTPQYGMDAEAVWMCIGNAIAAGGLCEMACGPSGTTCHTCLFGTCSGNPPGETCMGGACSMPAQTCDNDL